MFCMKTDKHEVSHRHGTAATDGSSSCLRELVFHLKIQFSECSHSLEIAFPSCVVDVRMQIKDTESVSRWQCRWCGLGLKGWKKKTFWKERKHERFWVRQLRVDMETSIFQHISYTDALAGCQVSFPVSIPVICTCRTCDGVHKDTLKGGREGEGEMDSRWRDGVWRQARVRMVCRGERNSCSLVGFPERMRRKCGYLVCLLFPPSVSEIPSFT